MHGHSQHPHERELRAHVGPLDELEQPRGRLRTRRSPLIPRETFLLGAAHIAEEDVRQRLEPNPQCDRTVVTIASLTWPTPTVVAHQPVAVRQRLPEPSEAVRARNPDSGSCNRPAAVQLRQVAIVREVVVVKPLLS